MTVVEDCHRAVDQICDGWRDAVIDLRPMLKARAYDGVTVTVGGHADPTGEQATTQSHAAGWVAELHDVTRMFLDPVPGNPGQLGAAWHRLFTECPTGWSPVALQRMWNLADDALRWWPPEAKTGDRVGDVVVGDGRYQVNDSTVCALCGAVLVAGHRREVPDGAGGSDWFCKSPCWYTITTCTWVASSFLRRSSLGE